MKKYNSDISIYRYRKSFNNYICYAYTLYHNNLTLSFFPHLDVKPFYFIKLIK